MALDRNKFKIQGGDQDWTRMWPEKDQPLKPGDSIDGIKVGLTENYGSNNSNVWILEVGEERIGVWGSTVIDEHMAKIPDGSHVGIEFAGMVPSVKRPGKEYKKFLIGVIDEDAPEPDGNLDEPTDQPPF